MAPTPRSSLVLASLLVLALAGCGGGGSGGSVSPVVAPPPTHVHQAAYRPARGGYAYDAAPFPTAPLVAPPVDADFSRWATLHDGTVHHLFCFARGTDAVLYRFGLNPATRAWELGFSGRDTYAVESVPEAADPSSIAMLYDGEEYRLYMRGISDRTVVFQFALDRAAGAFRYGYRSIPVLRVAGAPDNADFARWAMLHDGATYRLYLGVDGDPELLYQFAFDGTAYRFGHESIPVLSIVGMPANSVRTSFAMLHGGGNYLFHHLAR